VPLRRHAAFRLGRLAEIPLAVVALETHIAAMTQQNPCLCHAPSAILPSRHRKAGPL
jgi:hypothetical protein